MNEGKGLGFKWFNFLYGWFVFRIIMDCLSVLINIGQTRIYETMYGPLYEINELVYCIIFSMVVSIILKSIAVLTKNKQGGYAAVNFVLIWDFIHWFIWGFQYGWFGAIFSPLLASTFIIPNFFYLKKRKFIYGINEKNDFQTQAPSSLTKCEMCDKEENDLISAKIVDDLGTRYRKLCAGCFEKYNAEALETKSATKTDLGFEEVTEVIKFCRKCGSELLNNSEFCHKCGSAIVK